MIKNIAIIALVICLLITLAAWFRTANRLEEQRGNLARVITTSNEMESVCLELVNILNSNGIWIRWENGKPVEVAEDTKATPAFDDEIQDEINKSLDAYIKSLDYLTPENIDAIAVGYWKNELLNKPETIEPIRKALRVIDSDKATVSK